MTHNMKGFSRLRGILPSDDLTLPGSHPRTGLRALSLMQRRSVLVALLSAAITLPLPQPHRESCIRNRDWDGRALHRTQNGEPRGTEVSCPLAQFSCETVHTWIKS